MKRRMKKMTMTLGAIALTGMLTGCVSSQWTVKPTDLRTEVRSDNPYLNQIALGELKDGTSTSAFSKDHAFGSVVLSLQASLKSVGYLAPKDAGSAYVVDATLLENKTSGTCPWIFTSLVSVWFKPTSVIAVNYTLKDTSSGAEVYNATLRGTGKGSMNNDATARANAARVTVQQFLDDITSAASGQ